jgi:hypothetical protein
VNHIDLPYELLIPAVAAVLAAIIGAASAWYLAGAQRKKTEAEAKKANADAKKAAADAAGTLTGAALELVEKLQGQVDALEKDVEELQCEVERQRGRIRVVTKLNARLLRGAAILTDQLKELGQKPAWRVECDVASDDELVGELQKLGNATE